MATSGPETSQSADGGQESSTAQQALSGAPKPAMPSHAEESAFDLSSYDPLQAHAFQLTASAGLTNMNFAAPVPAPAMATATATATTAQAPQQGVVSQSYQPLAPPVPAPIYTTQAQPPQSAPAQMYYVQQPQQPQQPPQQPQHAQQPPQHAPPHPLVYRGLLTGSTQESLAPSQQALPAPVPAPPAPQPVQHVAPSQPHRELHQQQQVVLAPLQPAPLHPSPQYYLPNQTTQVAQPAPYNGQQTAPAPVAQHNVQAAIPVAGGLKRPSPGDAAAGPPQKKPQLVYPSMQLPSVSTSSGSETTPVSVQSSLNHDLRGDVDPINRKPPPNYAQMSAEEKRRYDRNLREQQRSFKISQQIKELRNVLAESNIPFKPNKFSILLSVVEYIKQLQSRAIMLDAEHRKLIATVKQTNELVNSGHTPEEDSSNDKRGQNIGNDADMLFVQGLNYKGVFDQCTAALSVAALDGRILACNNEFAAVSGFSRQQLLRQSVFNLMQNHEEVFKAMGAMLSGSEQACNGGLKGSKDAPLYWSGVVNQQNQNLCMNITLTRTAEGLPKFFNCALTST